MGAGDLTVTLVGSYATLALAIAAWTAGNDAAATDHHELIIDPAVGPNRYHLIKVARAAA